LLYLKRFSASNFKAGVALFRKTTSVSAEGRTFGFSAPAAKGFQFATGDGVNSAVKDYVAKGAIKGSGRKGNQALYSGLRIRYAIQDKNVVKPTDDEGATLTQFFGNGAMR
jgi:hypothetical protein